VEDILAADEMFLTNSLMGIMPVATFEGYRFPERGTSSALIEAYRDHKEEQLARR
jgi:branched-subunit amino acid aminotransferase/4-amino-4-deoxychorismate lyase